MRASIAKLTFNSSPKNTTRTPEFKSVNATADWPGNRDDDCPEEYYCVPLFDDASKPGYYQGFCCPSPGKTRPVCPVGEPHETSFPPDYGCDDCPIEFAALNHVSLWKMFITKDNAIRQHFMVIAVM
ncbi:hypothetical protein NECAME_01189 [Necator americanus]|uniref:Uncharacterized protein n=1 Tax=Necator americanus TaxID=51031 RepID=W2U133_NECAM|nr:hypothetical protein NECAME_01189 [Necator americanus]ETN87032.1 hypothetical protein NECAME_01189 [Necator americanus]